MKRIRVIPILLLSRGGLVKSVKFKKFTYIGDPINAVKIFNDKEVDEISVLDITATADKKGPDFDRIKQIAGEAFMPFSYGGGISSLTDIKQLIQLGAEKIILNYQAFQQGSLISQAAEYAGSQSVVVSIDVKKNLWGKYAVHLLNGTKNTGEDPKLFAKRVRDAGAGEIIINSIDRDGTFAGYDLALIEYISKAVDIPVVALGGASSVDDFAHAVQHGASAVAAGSMFVLQRPHRAVLIQYPTRQTLVEKLYSVSFK